MKTTLELPDDLMVDIKVRAAREQRSMKELVTEILLRGVERASEDADVHVSFPLVLTGEASPETEVTPRRAAEILGEQEADWATGEGDAE